MHTRLLLLLSLCSMSALGMESSPATSRNPIVAACFKKLEEKAKRRKERIENNEATFWVERPQDEYWNTAFGHVIIDAKEQKSEFGDGTVFQILSPDKYKGRNYSTEGWIECDGPSRKLSYDEYVDLIHKLLPGLKAPEVTIDFPPLSPKKE